MIIDFHTHSFPPKIADKALGKLSASSNILYQIRGTAEALQESMNNCEVDLSVLLPVSTSPAQHETVNRVAIETNNRWQETGIMSFGGIHPDNDNYKEIISNLAANGIKGIKIHPVFQLVNLDDIRYLRIIECACEHGLIVITHGGYDVSYPGWDHAVPSRIKNVMDTIHPDKFVVAHMGGWASWEEAEELLLGYPLWMDTSTCITPIHRASEVTPENRKWLPSQEAMSMEHFCRMIQKFGPDRFLMGSDSPWSKQQEAVDAIRSTGLSASIQQQILGDNAAKLLGIL